MTDAVRTLEHTHRHLTKLVQSIGQELHDAHGRPRPVARRKELTALVETLRDELLHHFADEEEGLFPFVRQVMPSKAAEVDALEGSHDAICGVVVRLAHIAQHDDGQQLRTLYERFERTYEQHSVDERRLFDSLHEHLDDAQQAQLADLLRGISAHH